MRFPMTIGLDVPGPGSSRFQTMFWSALQVIGGFESSRAPLPPGPRNWVQSAVAVESGPGNAAVPAARKRTSAAETMGHLFMLDAPPCAWGDRGTLHGTR